MGVGTALQTVMPRGKTGGVQRHHGSILIVDDDEVIRALFLEIFRPEGVSVRAAASSREALTMVKQAVPALLIVDVSLPDQDGIALLEAAQSIDNRIIGVVMTGAPTVELAVRAMKAGATDFLMKPIQNDMVLVTARRLLELHRLRAENTVLKHAAIRSGAVRLGSVPLQTFSDDGSLRGEDGLTEFERGMAEGRRHADEERRHERAAFADVVRAFEGARSALRRTFEDEVVSLAFHIANKVLHEAAESCKDQIVVQAKSAIGAVREPGAVVIRVHPADAPALAEAQAELAAQRDLALTLKIEPALGLVRGSCLLHTANRVIDASLDAQLLRLGSALRSRTERES